MSSWGLLAALRAIPVTLSKNDLGFQEVRDRRLRGPFKSAFHSPKRGAESKQDFILHEVQIYQAALVGADAVLLIVAALSDEELEHLNAAAEKIGIDCMVEVHDEDEVRRALDIGASFIGINNRNLATFELDLGVTQQLSPKIPRACTIVSESGIRTTDDVRTERAIEIFQSVQFYESLGKWSVRVMVLMSDHLQALEISPSGAT